MNNIQVVDSIVRQSEALFSEFYGDEKTTFFFTADHGMSQIGNHGDGGKLATEYFYRARVLTVPSRRPR